ncbi:MAG TPA: insulinase family protein [Gemmatimonadaceae bacterium]|nr:insulinase family protein [Gemmatimonadaceae bacterium]
MIALWAAALSLTLATPGPVDSATTDYIVGGVHVIQRRTSANDVIAVDLYFLGGTQLATATTAGIEPLALRAAFYGTDHYPGRAWQRARGRTGSVFAVGPTSDWTLVSFRGVVEQFDSTWALLADCVMHPTLDSATVAVARQRMIIAARARDISPDGALYGLADSVAFSGHPYGLHPSGTEASLAALSPNVLQRYVREQYVTSRMLLVVVGNIPRATIEAAVTRTLGTLPAGRYTWHPPSPVTPRVAPSLTVVERATATNYILGYFQGPPVTSRDYPSFELATYLLGARLSNAIRQQRSLSYAASAPFLGRALATGGIYVSSPDPAEVFPIVSAELDTIRTTSISARGYDYFVRQFVTRQLIAKGSSGAQAAALAEAQIYEGDYHRANLESPFRDVTPYKMQQAANKYMRNTQFVYLGDPNRVKGIRINGM